MRREAVVAGVAHGAQRVELAVVAGDGAGGAVLDVQHIAISAAAVIVGARHGTRQAPFGQPVEIHGGDQVIIRVVAVAAVIVVVGGGLDQVDAGRPAGAQYVDIAVLEGRDLDAVLADDTFAGVLLAGDDPALLIVEAAGVEVIGDQGAVGPGHGVAVAAFDAQKVAVVDPVGAVELGDLGERPVGKGRERAQAQRERQDQCGQLLHERESSLRCFLQPLLFYSVKRDL